MLQAGGNAVDAALATAIALTVVEPCSNGLGSDLFAIVWDGQELTGLNASGRAPAAWTPERFADLTAMPRTGWDTVTIPGAVSGWVALSRRFGKVPFADLFAPAIRYAAAGYAVSPVIAEKWAKAVPILGEVEGFAENFLPRARAPEVGEIFASAAMARTLQKIAETEGEAFYRGELAEAMVAHARAHRGAQTLSDFAAHRCDWVTPLAHDYHGYTIHEIPPNGQGIAALMALGILENHDVGTQPADSITMQHLEIEAMKLAFADVYRYVGDPTTMRVTSAQLLDRGYLAARARLIDRNRAQDFGHGTPPPGGTVYLAAGDERGMMVSLIQSNYMGFGSGIVVPGTGISLQNRGTGFSLELDHPNQVGGGKRPFHTIIPGFVTRDGAPYAAFGVMGGPIQPQAHLQTLVRLIDYRGNPQAVLDAPRWKVNGGLSVDLETDAAESLRDGLLALGHTFASVPDSYMDFGAGQFVVCTENGYIAGSDPRRDGQAAGY
jgi:gamma-glutamyltranspeptidase/glutathione hydrolase